MKRNSMMARRAAMSAFIVAATVATTGIVTAASFAQPPAGGGGNGGGRRGGGQGRGGMQMTVGSIPASALAVGLKLTDDQKTKIEAAQKPMMDLQKSMMPTPGQQMDRTAMMANFQKMGEMRTKADADVNAVLTDEQKAMVPALLKKLTSLRGAGIQPGIYGDLKLSADQETQIIDIAEKAQRKAREDRDAAQANGTQYDYRAAMTDTKTKVEAVLNASQKQTLEEYDKAHPMMQMGGGRMGGGGGRRGGGGGAAGGGAAPAGGGGNL